jgi:beta-lactam-binding protein with PASTA domain
MLCDMDRRPGRPPRVLAALALALSTVLASLIAATPASAADMPNVVGLTYPQAVLALQAWDPSVKVLIEPYDPTTDTITLQPGFTVPDGLTMDRFDVAAQQEKSTVRSFVAVGPAGSVVLVGLTEAVPDLTGLTSAEANNLLQSGAMTLVPAGQTPTDVVTQQDPAATTVLPVQAFPVARIVVQLSPPPPTPVPVVVPDVVGMSVRGAQDVLRAVGLGNTVAPADASGSDTITRQNPAAGASVDQGSGVRLTAEAPKLVSASGGLPSNPTMIAVGVGVVLLLILLLTYLLIRAARRSKPRGAAVEPPHRAAQAPVVSISFRAAEPPRHEASVYGPSIRIGLTLRPEPTAQHVSEVKA